VNNAGVSTLAPVAATDERDLRRMIDVNLVGTFLGLRTAVTSMRAHGKDGRVINIASELGVQAFPYLGAYSATKFAVVGLTQAAALELAPEHITVNAVCPGTAETEMVAAERLSEAALTAQSVDEVRASYLAGIPSGRFCAPDDVGALVAYLASPGAAYVTGQSICVNGGSVLR
jgi:NAD(P)-dependent dehydrogenase (short-subunit alcohol dehydrogenase family)